MNPGIFYLYEYKNTQKLRNVGFLKLSLHYRTCEMQVNLRGIPVKSGDSLKLYTFFEQDSVNYAGPLAEIDCENNRAGARLSILESELPAGRTLDTVNGFFLRSSSGNCYAALSPDTAFDTEMVSLWDENNSAQAESKPDQNTPAPLPENNASNDTDALPGSSTEKPDTRPEASEKTDNAQVQKVEESIPDDNSNPAQSEVSPPSTLTPQEISSELLEPSEPSEPSNDTKNEAHQQEAVQNVSASETVRKIQRSDLSILPRRSWNIANNSFLMHGYHNYNHLLLVEEEGHFWIGVPGIFAPRESRAAELFGFPQFTNTYVAQLELTADERDESEDFGHWCRFIR